MRVRAVLCDIDGVLTVSWRAIPGAPEALRRIRGAGLPVAFLTNTTSRTRDAIAAAMLQAGFDADPEEIFTATAIGAAYLRRTYPGARVHLLTSGDVRADLGGVDLADAGERPDVVVLGGAGPEFSYQALSRVFGHLVDGVPLVAMHRNSNGTLDWVKYPVRSASDGVSTSVESAESAPRAAAGGTDTTR
jgi:HAD superfamily hydrolase (TIGR01450 family)